MPSEIAREKIDLERRRFVPAFVVSFGLGVATRLISQRLDGHFGGHPSGTLIVVGLVVGLGAFVASVYYAIRSYKFASVLEYGKLGSVAFGFMSLFPLLNLVIVLLLLHKARKLDKSAA